MKFDHDLHIHSVLSTCCAHPHMTPDRLLEYALEYSLGTICITDHFWDDKVEGAAEWYKPQNFEHICESLPLPKAQGVRFLFGAETELDNQLRLGIAKETIDKLDFLVIPTTHANGFVLENEENSEEKRAAIWVKRVGAVLQMDLPFKKVGLAHLACCTISPKRDREEVARVLSRITEEDLNKIFSRAASLGVGIELNGSDMDFQSETEQNAVIRIFKIAKECGCKFYFGSDCHHPARLGEVRERFERAIKLLGLTEEDKFILN